MKKQERVYWAHSANREGRRQPLKLHLRQAARLAREFAERARPEDAAFAGAAYWAGLLHDVGKYQEGFQRRLSPSEEGLTADPCAHAPVGAVKAMEHGQAHAFAIAGHHAGLPARGDLMSLRDRWEDVAGNVWAAACEDCPDLAGGRPPELPQPIAKDRLRADIWIRMIFSCLVDADWSDTNAWEHGRHPYCLPSAQMNPRSCLDLVLKHLRGKPRAGSVNAVRRSVLRDCLAAASMKSGFFSLTVPTGGGKTLSSLAFALKHCLQHKDRGGPRRIIYVIPYLNILEQTAEAVCEALGIRRHEGGGIVFEHHSLAYAGRLKREDRGGETFPEEPQTPLAARMEENWEAPIVLTTSVQFFESVFSNRPAAARKLHNIARSVVIFDECQTFPAGLYGPTLSMLRELVESYGVSFIFCTATQPALKQRPGFPAGIPSDQLREIASNPARLFREMHRRADRPAPRIRVTWPSREEGRSIPWGELAARMRQAGSALAIVNLKAHAKSLFHALGGKPEAGCPPEVFHLSSMMCPQHRLERLAAIRGRLDRGESCLVASTQLVEAGVDLDFPTVFRAMGPLDSIAQAAGRCNREGRLKDDLGRPRAGEVVVFLPELEDNAPETPPGEYRAGTEVTKEFLSSARLAGLEGPDVTGAFPSCRPPLGR